MANKDRKREYNKAYYNINKEKINIQKKRYKEANKNKISIHAKAYYESHKEKIVIRGKTYRKNNKEKIKERGKNYYKLHKNEIKFCRKLYYKNNKKKKIAYAKEYQQINKDKIAIRKKIYYENNRKNIITQSTMYRKANKDSRNLYIRNYYLRRKQDELFYNKYKLNNAMSTAVGRSLKEGKNGASWLNLVPYTLKQLKRYLEKKFIKGMTWNNYGKNGWHIDHRIPISVFNFTDHEHRDFQRCWALKNLQPMWASENISKSNKLTKHFQPSLLL